MTILAAGAPRRPRNPLVVAVGVAVMAAVAILAVAACSAEAPERPAAGDDPVSAPGPLSTAEMGRIEPDSFALVLHQADRFTPPPESVWDPRHGHEFVALDIALHNQRPDSLDLGVLMIAPSLVDAEGNRYPFRPDLVAAFEMEAPNRARFDVESYEKLVGGRLAAGESARGYAWAFEVPKDAEGLRLEFHYPNPGDRHHIPLGP